MGWINSDDVLLPGALNAVGRVFALNPEVEWITGLASTMNASGAVYRSVPQYPFRRASFWLGQVRGIQQESTFWRRRLWQRAGGRLDTNYRFAADYELWSRFFLTARLVCVPLALGAFRRHGRQITCEDRGPYDQEVEVIRRTYRRLLTPLERLQGPFLLAAEMFARHVWRQRHLSLAAPDSDCLSHTGARGEGRSDP
jgi:hypothetical protein